MKTLRFLYCLLALVLCTVFVACDEDLFQGDGENMEGTMTPDIVPQKFNVSGKVEKGPFVSGSTISIQPMDAKMQALGKVYTSTIQDHLGNFSFGTNLYESPYAELSANGYFFNEVTGSLSLGTLYLRAVVDLSKSETVNVNIITHIKYQRVLNLIAQGKTFAEANSQAQRELLAAFGLQKYADKDASLYSIIEGTDESAALIAISSLILIDRTEAAVTEYLARLCREFGEEGVFSAETKALITADRKKIVEKLSTIRGNIKDRYDELGIEVEVRDLSLFFDWDDDGTAGNERLKEGESIALSVKRLEIPYSGGSYTVKIESPIPVYLEPHSWGDSVVYPETTYPTYEGLFKDFYKVSDAKDDPIRMEKSITGNELHVEVSSLESYRSKEESVVLYDCMGGVLDTLFIIQEANPNIAPPQFLGLGQTALAMVGAAMVDFAKAASNFNLLEQYYQYNKNFGFVGKHISPQNNTIHTAWSSFYSANNRIAQMRDYDEKSRNAYGAEFDVFTSMLYYYMVVGWGDVPYILKPIINNSGDMYASRTDQDVILDDMTRRLTAAIEVLEEKEYESLNIKDMNELFLVSKDVARILLANIHMYRGKYAEAQALLHDVIEAGFYALDGSKYSDPNIFESPEFSIEPGEELPEPAFDRNSSELIFVLDASSGTRTTRSVSISIANPMLVPLMTYTDVMLSYAECLYRQGNASDAERYLQEVVKAKNITVSDDVLNGIMDARQQLLVCCNSNLAFYKRNGIAVEELKIESHQLLLPIPLQELYKNYNLTQNPGYE